MKIYTYIRIDIFTLEVIEEESFEYNGPLALCWGDPGDADEGGNYGMGSDSDGDGWSDYEADAMGIGRSPSNADRDASDYESDAYGVGRYGGRMQGDYESMAHYGEVYNDIMGLSSSDWARIAERGGIWETTGIGYFSSLMGFIGFTALAVWSQGWSVVSGIFNELDPLSFSDLLSWASEKFLGKWSFDPADRLSYGPPGETGAGATAEGGDKSPYAQAVDKGWVDPYGYIKKQRGVTDQQQQLRQQQIDPSRWYVPEGGTFPQPASPKINIQMSSPYSMINFPPPVVGDMYSQPKVSIWCV